MENIKRCFAKNVSSNPVYCDGCAITREGRDVVVAVEGREQMTMVFCMECARGIAKATITTCETGRIACTKETESDPVCKAPLSE